VALLVSLSSATDEEGTKFLEKKSNEDGVLTLSSGLRYKIINKGSGAFHPMMNSPCLCHYAGTLIDGTEFDSSYSRGDPTTFAPNQVIKGWTEAMQLMVEGDKWELYIPSDLAYGASGSPPKIPGDSALVFTIEMIEIKGEKIIALKCNPSTFEDCDDKMKKYIVKVNTKFGGDKDELDEEIETTSSSLLKQPPPMTMFTSIGPAPPMHLRFHQSLRLHEERNNTFFADEFKLKMTENENIDRLHPPPCCHQR